MRRVTTVFVAFLATIAAFVGFAGPVPAGAASVSAWTPVIDGPSRADAINEAGLVVGQMNIVTTNPPTFGPPHAFARTAAGTTADLGTLGGTSSEAFAVNDAGVIVGSAQTTNNAATRAFRRGPGGGPLSNLGTLGGTNSSAQGVNTSGVIVGQADLSGNTASHAFAWDPTTHVMRDLGTLPGGTSSIAYGINDAGLVVGSSTVPGTAPCSSGPTCPINHGFVYDLATGHMTDIGTVGGANSAASAINDAGLVVGTSEVGGPDPCFVTFGVYCPATDPFSFDVAHATLTDLGRPSGTTHLGAVAVNRDGVVVAGGDDLPDTVSCSHCPVPVTTWVLGRGEPWQSIAGTAPTVSGINDAGQVVGSNVLVLDPFVFFSEAAMSSVAFASGPPTALAGVGCGPSVTLSWSAPAFTGYRPVTSYTVTRDGITVGTAPSATFTDPATHAGAVYRVTANNGVGDSAPSAALTWPAPACAPANVTGTVTDGTTGVAGIDVRVYVAGTGTLAAKTVTAADGTYTTAAVAPGAYQVRFSDASGSYALQWFAGSANRSGATTLNLASAPVTADATLSRAAAVAGTVTNGTTGVAGIDVRIYVAGTDTLAAKAVTAGDGTYTTNVMVPGDYQVRFSDATGTYTLQWFAGAPKRSGATTLHVVSGPTTADATLTAAPG